MNTAVWRDRLGFPDTARRKRLVVIAAVDSLGTGLFLPLSLLYFVNVADMDVAKVGLALSIGAGLALLGGPHTGTLIDRIGPGNMAALSCLVRTGAFFAYLGADQFWQIIAISAVVVWSENAFWPSNSAMIIALCGREQRARWYALGRTVRSVGMGLGAALSGVIVAAGSNGAQRVVAINALSFAVVAALLYTWREARTTTTIYPEEEKAEGGSEDKRAGLRNVLADRPFLLVVASNTLLAVCAMSLIVLLPLHADNLAPNAAWLPGLLFAVNSGLLMLAQGPAVRRIEASHPSHILQASVALYAAGFVVFIATPNTGGAIPIVVMTVAVVLYTAGELVHPPTSVILVTDMARSDLLGRYLSVNQLSWSVSHVITPAALAGLFAMNVRLPWLVLLATCAAASGLLVLATRGHQPKEAAAA
ncbi:MFS transporter [Streptomyces cellulosae]